MKDHTMQIKSIKETSLTPSEIADILAEALLSKYNLNGTFDINFVVTNKPKPCPRYYQDSVDNWVFDGAKIKVNE
jgi:hypothetical protein